MHLPGTLFALLHFVSTTSPASRLRQGTCERTALSVLLFACAMAADFTVRSSAVPTGFVRARLRSPVPGGTSQHPLQPREKGATNPVVGEVAGD
jgi:hypothetical protein